MAHAYCSWTGCYWTGSSYRLSPTRHRYFRNLFMLRSERSERSSSSYKKNVYNPIALGLYTLAEEKSRFDFNHNALRRQPQCLALATTMPCAGNHNALRWQPQFFVGTCRPSHHLFFSFHHLSPTNRTSTPELHKVWSSG